MPQFDVSRFTAEDWARLDVEIAYKERIEAGEDGRAKPLAQYQLNPIGFLTERLRIPRRTIVWSENPGYEGHVWDGTPDPLVAICNAVAAGQNVVVKSATGTGKSYLAAGLAMWFEASWFEARIGTYAPRESQLRDYMWAEMGKHWRAFREMFPSALMQDLKLFVDGSNQDERGREAWSAVGKAVQIRAGEPISTAAQGIHGPHMMLFVEEGEGVAAPVFEALENTCTAPHNFMMVFGNPNSELGTLHQLSMRPSWVSITISALDHPNVVCDDADIVPGAVSRKSILDRAEKYHVPLVNGRYDLHSDDAHPSFKSRVRGIPPGQSERALIKLGWVYAAQSRWRALVAQHGGSVAALEAALTQQEWPHALGIDPSQSPDGDRAGVAHFVGPVCLSVTAEPCPNAKHLGKRLFLEAQRLQVDPRNIGVDAIGVGSSTANELNDLYEPRRIKDLHSGGAPFSRVAKAGEDASWVWDSNLFRNLRAQMYWQLAMDLQAGTVALPDDKELAQELVAPEYDDTGGKTIIEGKEDIRERLGRSPNKADAVVYANWVRARTTPVDKKKVDPDNQSLGWRKNGDTLQPLTLADLRKPPALPKGARGVKKYWGKR